MPAGRVHAQQTLRTINIAAPLIGYMYGSPLATIAGAVGIITGLVMTPDLDCTDGYFGLYLLRKIPRIGPVLSAGWRVLWWPYSRLVPHRSPISHFPVIGSMLRVIYLMLWYWLIRAFSGHPESFAAPTNYLFYAWLWGVISSDIIHIISDNKQSNQYQKSQTVYPVPFEPGPGPEPMENPIDPDDI